MSIFFSPLYIGIRYEHYRLMYSPLLSHELHFVVYVTYSYSTSELSFESRTLHRNKSRTPKSNVASLYRVRSRILYRNKSRTPQNKMETRLYIYIYILYVSHEHVLNILHMSHELYIRISYEHHK